MKFLKNKGAFLLALCLFMVFTTSLFAQESEKSIFELRKLAMQEYRSEISAVSFHEIPVDNLGVWNDILESSLFMLIRKTELYRGRMRVIIEESSDAKCKIYPDGTILISTAIFDYIDSKLANTQNMSPRKIKNFNIEREKMLASFLVHQVANFVQEKNLLRFSKKQNIKNEDLKSSNMEADKFAMLILKVAGYDSNIFYDHLEELKRIQHEYEDFKRFGCFFEEHFDPKTRISNLLKNVTEAEILAEEVSSILESLKGNSLNSLEDAKQKLLTLKNEFPDNMYFKRLFALVLHKKWMLSVQHKQDELLTSYPASMELENTVYNYFSILNFNPENLRIKQEELSKQEEINIENVNAYDEAVRAYQEYLSSIEEAGMLSSYSMLLHYSNKAKERLISMPLAEKAYLQENGTESLTSALNYSALLYMTGKDYTKAKRILQKSLGPTQLEKPKSLFLRTGKNNDERLLLFNYARMLFGLGELKLAEKIKDKLKLLLFSLDRYEKISLKKIALASSTDDLIEYWGKPALIQYNYFLERWHYNFLNVDIYVSPQDGNLINRIRINLNSNLTLPGELRVGESKKYFEKIFGRSLYYNGDFKNYFYKGNKIQVFFINDYAREIIITRLNNGN